MTEPNRRVIVDGIELGSILLFPRILLSAIAALQPPRLIIALLMVTALITGGRIWDRFTTPCISPTGSAWTEADQASSQGVIRRAGGAWLDLPDTAAPLEAGRVMRDVEDVWRRQVEAAGEDGDGAPDVEMLRQTLRAIDGVRPRGTFEATATTVSTAFTEAIRGVLSLAPRRSLEAGVDLYLRLPATLWRADPAFTIVYGLFALLVLTLGGGALSRMAACHWSCEERLRVSEAWDFVFGRWWTFFTTPLLPLFMALLFAVVIALLGWFMRLPWMLEVLGALLYLPALVLGAGIALLAVGYVLGAVLLVPAVACERCDAPEAQQRAYAYVLNRPFHRVGYGLVALVGLALGYLVVSVFVMIMLNGTAAIFGALAGDAPALHVLGGVRLFDLTGGSGAVGLMGADDRAAAAIVGFFQTAILCLVPAYVLSYVFTASTFVYLLMRRVCDGQAIEEIWRPGDRIPGRSPADVERIARSA